MDPESLPCGGPAFPTENAHQSGHSTWHHEGMTLRDYFAAKAMQAYLSGHDRGDFGYDEWAKASYDMADALLKERGATS